MTLDRAIAIIFLVICLVYGYTAFVIIEEGLLPFELNMTVLPNTLPKVLSIIGIIIALTVIFTTGKAAEKVKTSAICKITLKVSLI